MNGSETIQLSGIWLESIHSGLVRCRYLSEFTRHSSRFASDASIKTFRPRRHACNLCALRKQKTEMNGKRGIRRWIGNFLLCVNLSAYRINNEFMIVSPQISSSGSTFTFPLACRSTPNAHYSNEGDIARISFATTANDINFMLAQIKIFLCKFFPFSACMSVWYVGRDWILVYG